MDELTKKTIEDNFNKFMDDAGINLNYVRNGLSAKFNRLMMELDNNEMINDEEIQKEYKKSYLNLIKEIYDHTLSTAANPTFTVMKRNNVDMAFPTIKTVEDTIRMLSDIIQNFDSVMANCAKKVYPTMNTSDLVLGGFTSEELLNKLKDIHQDETAKNDFLIGRDTEKPLLEEGLELCDKAGALERANNLEFKPNTEMEMSLASVYLEKKVAAAYCQMREEHRSHSIFWRWFKGGESRARLNELKTAYCKAFNVSKRNATNRMLRLESDKSPTQAYHDSVVNYLDKNNILCNIDAYRKYDKLDEYEAVISDGVKLPSENTLEEDLMLSDINKELDVEKDNVVNPFEDFDIEAIENKDNDIEPFDTKDLENSVLDNTLEK